MNALLNTLRNNQLIDKYGLRYCAFLAVLLLVSMQFFGLPRISHATIERTRSGFDRPIVLPDLSWHKTGGFSYVFQINYAAGEQTHFMLHPQACIDQITLNYHQVEYDHKKKCDLDGGLPLTLDLQPGANQLKIETKDKGLTLGPVVFDHEDRGLSDWLGYGLALTACASLMILIRRFTGEWLTGGIMSGGLLVYLYQFSRTGYTQFAHDIFGHLEYIDYIVHHAALPETSMNFSTYHPPLYYILQAFIEVVMNIAGTFDVISCMRFFSMCCFMLSMAFMALTLRRLVPNRLAYYAALLILVFYPSGVMLASRLNSDLLFYTFFSGCAYFLLRWLQDSHENDLAMTLAMLGLGIAARSNMLIMLPVVGIAGLYQWKGRGQHLRTMFTRPVWMAVAIMVLGAVCNFGRSFYYHYTDDPNSPLIVGSAQHLWNIAPGLRVGNTVADYLTMNIHGYFRQPFWNVWWDNSDRKFFWNSLFKSSLFGEFHWNQPFLAQALDTLLLILIVFCIAGVVACRKDPELRRKVAWSAVVLLIPIIALAMNRILNPLSCSQDFRYIYPCIVGFCGIFGLSMERFVTTRNYIMAGAGGILSLIFTTTAVLFFLGQ